MPAALSIPPLAFHQQRLPNGLRLLSVEDHTNPTVALQVWYHVGSRDDPQGRSGFAHLFEHLMFKRTRHMADEALDRLTEDVGGSNNASTGPDVTNYVEVIPANHLRRLLWAEAERMRNLTVDTANFHSERAVVEEEYRQSVLADPYGRLFDAIDSHSYQAHPYRRPTIGNIEELEAASLADVIAFHDTWYRPDNATLIVVGDFNPAALTAWVEDYFGSIPTPASPLPRTAHTEPARTQAREVTLTSAIAPLPALALTWLTPPAAHADSLALEVAANVLAGGDSSRLYQALVYRTGMASQIGAFADERVGPGLFTAYAILASGHTPTQAAASIQEEIERLANGPLAAAELAKVKTQLLTDELGQRQTAQGKAYALGHAALIEGDVNAVNRRLERLQALTARTVQQALRTWITSQPSLTLHYLPDANTSQP